MIAYCVALTWKKTIVLVVMIDPSCPSYFTISFCVVVSKMSLALLWQPPKGNVTYIMMRKDMYIVNLLGNEVITMSLDT